MSPNLDPPGRFLGRSVEGQLTTLPRCMRLSNVFFTNLS
jgi:hypothetical protein